MGGGFHGGFGNTKGNANAVAGDAIYKSGDKLYFDYISKRKDIDSNGKYDFVAHGKAKNIQVSHNGKDVDINSRVAAKLLKNRDDYKKGQPIRLLSCDTGKGNNSFAQSLANKLNVTVYAPTEKIWANPNGTHFIAASMKNNSSKADLKKLGYFKKFIPGGNK